MREVVGFSMARDAAQQVYEAAGIGPQDIDVVELHDCFAQNELISYEALGLCPLRAAPRNSSATATTLTAARSSPIRRAACSAKAIRSAPRASRNARSWSQQLRGSAEKRQVEGARLALQHNLGLGGACVVTLYERI